MREIKFRAYVKEYEGPLKVIDLSKEDEYFVSGDGHLSRIVYEENGAYIHYFGVLGIDEHYAAQVVEYTGIKDKNGVEIYEGDIVLGGHPKVMVIVYDERQCRFQSCPINMYKINEGCGFMTGRSLSSHLEVVGNIYEHPHLLEVNE